MNTRREFLASATAVGIWPLSTSHQLWAAGGMLRRPVPATGENIPVIGMGTSGTFQVSLRSKEYNSLREILKRFFAGGGALIDIAPTYGNAEDVLGALLEEAGSRSRAFIATKLSHVRGRHAGLEQFKESLQRLRTDHVELLQIHNLGDWKTQLALARELKSQGKVKYVGLTHYTDDAQEELPQVVQAAKPDFVQLTYSVAQRSAEKRVLPLAKELGIAVIANRPFDDGALFRRVAGKPLPGWARDVGATSWAQLFLKFSLSHDAVTVVIPSTSKSERQTDNLGAGFAPTLTETQRRELIRIV